MDWSFGPALTPGPLGLFDQGDPNFTTVLGDTPGPLGMNDANDPSMSPFGSALDYAVFISHDTIRRALENDSDDGRVAASAAVKPSSAAWERTEQSRVPAWNPAASDRVMANLLANSERLAANKSSPRMWDRITEQGKAVLDATAEAVDDAGRTLRRAVTIDSPDEARERAERIEQRRAQEFRKSLAADLLAHGMIDNGAICTRLGPVAVAVQPASAHPAYHDSFDQRIARSTADALELYAGGALIDAVALPILTAGGKVTLRYLSAEAKLSFGLRQELRSSLKIAKGDGIESAQANGMSNASRSRDSGPAASQRGAEEKVKGSAPEVVAEANATAGIANESGLVGKYSIRNDVAYRPASEVNATFPEGWSPPYKPGSRVTEFTNTVDDTYVRVHGENNMVRSWMMKQEAIDGLTAGQIQSKYALPELPTYMSEIRVPAGTRIRTGIVNPVFGGIGNATQYELLQRLPASAFSNTVRLGQ